MKNAHPRFSLALPRSLQIGRGSIARLPSLVGGPGQRVAVVGGSGSVTADVTRILTLAGYTTMNFTRHGEPTLESLERLIGEIAEFGPETVIGVGGGSAIDSAKAVAALIPNSERPPSEYLRPGDGAPPLGRDPLRCIAVPTTAGTGAEATANAVVVVDGVKVSLRDARIVPAAAVVDGDLGDGVPIGARVAAAFDAVVQLVEAYATPLGNPFSTGLAYAGAELAFPVLPRIVSGSESADDRQAMATAATLSGLALANSKLGTVHGFAGVIGGRTQQPHGMLCGVFAQSVMETTISILRESAPSDPALVRYRDLARLCTGRRSAEAEDLAEWFGRQATAAGFPQPRIPIALHAELARATSGASSTAGNPIEIPIRELVGILESVTIGSTEESRDG